MNGLTITTRLMKCHHHKLCTFLRHFIWIIGNIYFGNGDKNLNWHEIVTHISYDSRWLTSVDVHIKLIKCGNTTIISKIYMHFLSVNEVDQFKAEIIGLFKHIHNVRSCKPATGLWRNNNNTPVANCYNSWSWQFICILGGKTGRENQFLTWEWSDKLLRNYPIVKVLTVKLCLKRLNCTLSRISNAPIP